MQIVIDLDEDTYRLVKNELVIISGMRSYKTAFNRILVAIVNGTPLPKGHGRLKDEDEIIKAIEDRVDFLKQNDAIFMRLRKDIDILGCIPKIRCEVPTIIEANKESEDK